MLISVGTFDLKNYFTELSLILSRKRSGSASINIMVNNQTEVNLHFISIEPNATHFLDRKIQTRNLATKQYRYWMVELRIG